MDMQETSTPTPPKRRRRARNQNNQSSNQHNSQIQPPKESTHGLDDSGTEQASKDIAPKSHAGSWRVSKKRLDILAQDIAATYATAGIFISARDQYDGLLIIATSTERASELAVALSHNKQFFELAEKIFKQGDIMKCVIGHGMTAYAILAHHDRLPTNHMLLQQFGFLPEQIYAKFNIPTTNEQQSGANGSTQPGATMGLSQEPLATG